MYVNCGGNPSGPTCLNNDHNKQQQQRQQQQQQFKHNEYVAVKSQFNTNNNNNNNNNEDGGFCCTRNDGKVNEVRYAPQWMANHSHATVFFYNNEEELLLQQHNQQDFPNNLIVNTINDAKNNNEQQRGYGTVVGGSGGAPNSTAGYDNSNYSQEQESSNKCGTSSKTTATLGRPATSGVLSVRPHPSTSLSYLNTLPMTVPPGFETFCTVPGRTSLLSSTAKYRVTIDEVRRRISPPECLNASLLGGILRKAKSKNGGKTLRESLRRVGLSLPAGRRKSAAITAWTALVEEEALHMARDFHAVCHRDFPAKTLAAFVHARGVAHRHRSIPVGPGADAHGAEANGSLLRYHHHDHGLSQQRPQASDIHAERRAMLNHSRAFIHELSDVLNMDRSPICGNRPDLLLDPSIQRPLTHFSMMTHGFGGLAFMAVLDALNAYVHESLMCLSDDARRTCNNNNDNNSISERKQQAKMSSQAPANIAPATTILPSITQTMRSGANPAPF